MSKIKAMTLSLAFFALAACGGGLTDSRDGKKYKTVKIGEQTWMAENLNIETGNSVCYDNNPENCQKYGRLYDWETAMKACPSGWHLPSNAEWDKLLRYVDGTNGTESPYESPTAGKYLKAKSGWNKKDNGESGNGTDNHGFSAMPSGFGNSVGRFVSINNSGYWWSTAEKYNIEYDTNDAYGLGMVYDDDFGGWDDYYKNTLFSVRCVKD